MKDVGAAIIERLQQDVGWWGSVGGRVDWTISQPETPYPRVVLLIVSQSHPNHYDGPDPREARLQLDVYSDRSAEEASTIAGQAIPILQPDDVAGGIWFRRAADIDGPTDSGDRNDTLYVYRARTDFALMFTDEED